MMIDKDWLRRKTEEDDYEPVACVCCGAIAGTCQYYPTCREEDETDNSGR